MRSICKNWSMFFFLFVLLSSSLMFAQQNQGNVVVLNNSELSLSNEGTMAEFDSLTQLYNTKVLAQNELIISFKTIRHWWGNDNTDFITIYEVKNWEDVTASNQRNNELFMAAWPTEEARKEFNDTYNKYFTGKHSDEIYQEVVFNK